SDEEVEYREEPGKLYYVNYPLVDSESRSLGRSIAIATQRPETIMGDTAICVNPSDERYRNLAGKFAIVPLVNRKVPIIFDEYVDPAFGTGALKVTPAHDINDYNLGLKHGLPVIDTLNPDGTLSEAAEVFVGLDRFAARKKVVEQLRTEGLMVLEEDYHTRLGYSQRTNAVVEPRISTQWFVRMKEMAGPALEAVINGHITIHPGDKFLATYKYWLENVKDWCISRQLWWGQRIPAWYAPDGSFQVAATREEAYAAFGAAALGRGSEGAGAAAADSEAGVKASSAGSGGTAGGTGFGAADLRQDDDVLDTWFSSWLWPIEVFKGITDPGNPDINYYYPTAVLVTGQDIIFFWVARMIMAGLYEFKANLPIGKRIPFRDVYFTGMVRDKQGRKMSKSLGNSPDLLALIDKYGADAVRFGIMISSPAGNDLLFDEAALEQGRNFNNKLWNALKLVSSWADRLEITGGMGAVAATDETGSSFAVGWFGNRMEEVRTELETLFAEFRLSEALKTIYSLIWDDFCSWYLEWIKPGFEQPMDAAIYRQTVGYFEQLLQLLHPFMPFITEEIYHLLAERSDDLCMKQFSAVGRFNTGMLDQANLLKEAITALRDARNKAQLKPREAIRLHIQSDAEPVYRVILPILSRQVNASVTGFTSEAIAGTLAVVSGKDKFYVGSEQMVDSGNQKEDLLKELAHLKGFLELVNKKLGNERFVQHAKPEVVNFEIRKRDDAETKIRIIEQSLAEMG
ncbi:MAG TPA: valine--tRNA ligase, partial [Puia sp.]|nr:valine--tRNA ligase [Puia sp.]